MSEPTQPSIPTDRPVSLRKLRHSIQKHAYYAAITSAGQPGLAKADQMIRMDKCIEELETALAKAKAARDLVASRDFDAHQATKAAKQVPHDALPDSAEKSAEQMTFDDLIKQLGGDQTPDDGQQPPF